MAEEFEGDVIQNKDGSYTVNVWDKGQSRSNTSDLEGGGEKRKKPDDDAAAHGKRRTNNEQAEETTDAKVGAMVPAGADADGADGAAMVADKVKNSVLVAYQGMKEQNAGFKRKSRKSRKTSR